MKKFKKIILIFLICICGLLVATNVKAASANISANKTTVNVGETVTITVNANAAAWEIHVTGAVSGNYADTSDSGENTSVTKTLTFTPKSEGTYTVKMSGNVSDGSTNATSSIGGSVTITAKSNTSSNNSNSSSSNNSNSGNSSTATTPAAKSNVATLSNLGISPNDFSGFSPSKTSYSTEVPNDVETIEIYAKKGQSGQTISGTGKKTLKEGTNTFSIVVTAEDGKTQKTYTLNITRKAQEDTTSEENEISPEEAEDPTAQAFGLTELTISGIELKPQFKTDVYEYTADLKSDLNTLDIKAIATEENAKVEITGNENLQNGENIITITVKGDGEDKNVTYKITVSKEVAQEKEVDVSNKKEKLTYIIIAAVIAIIIIILVVFIVKKVTNEDESFIPYQDLNNDEKDDKEINENDDIEETKQKKKNSKGKRFK